MDRFARRREALGELLSPGRAYLSTDPINVRYLTGFTGSSGTILVGPSGTMLITDGRYQDQAARECPNIELVIDRMNIATAGRLVSDRGWTGVTVPSEMPYGQITSLRSMVPDVMVVDQDPVAELRRVKDAGELTALRKACAITSEALMAVARSIRLGDREVDIARRLEAEFALRGAEDRAFPTIVATGINSAIPHHRPTDTPVRAGDLLVIDCGARVDGYHADMTRTFAVGGDPDSWQRAIFDVVYDAAAAGRAAVREGATCAAVDAAARSLVTSAGYGEHFTHGTGHAVGLVIHEVPMLNSESADTLTAGMAVTVEPGIYLPALGGVRIEDTLEVIRDGAVVLTEAPRALECVG